MHPSAIMSVASADRSDTFLDNPYEHWWFSPTRVQLFTTSTGFRVIVAAAIVINIMALASYYKGMSDEFGDFLEVLCGCPAVRGPCLCRVCAVRALCMRCVQCVCCVRMCRAVRTFILTHESPINIARALGPGQIVDYCTYGIFVVEMVLLMYAMSPGKYWASNWNRLDAFVVICSGLGIIFVSILNVCLSGCLACDLLSRPSLGCPDVCAGGCEGNRTFGDVTRADWAFAFL